MSGHGNQDSDYLNGRYCKPEVVTEPTERAQAERELLPCPFCGSNEIRAPSAKHPCCSCAGCGAEGPIATNKPELIAAWNTRTNPAVDCEAGQAPRGQCQFGPYGWRGVEQCKFCGQPPPDDWQARASLPQGAAPAQIDGVIPEDGKDGGHIASRIERWYVEGLHTNDDAKCPYVEWTVAERWWKRGAGRIKDQRAARARAAPAQDHIASAGKMVAAPAQEALPRPLGWCYSSSDGIKLWDEDTGQAINPLETQLYAAAPPLPAQPAPVAEPIRELLLRAAALLSERTPCADAECRVSDNDGSALRCYDELIRAALQGGPQHPSLKATPYGPAILLDDVRDAARYRTVRRMSTRQFTDAYVLNIRTGKHFDEIIDDLAPFVHGDAAKPTGGA